LSIIYLILSWVIVTSLGIAAIVALEPLWLRSGAEHCVNPPRGAVSRAKPVVDC